MRPAALFLALPLAILAGCSKPAPPVGKWEGGYSSNSTLVVARVEIMPDGQVRLMAPDITGLDLATPVRMTQLREQLAADLATGWDSVAPRKFDFDGKTFRKPGGLAPQMVWDKSSNQMTVNLYIGANPALPVHLRPVDGFHDDPWPKS
jgi:hypothetical protein